MAWRAKTYHRTTVVVHSLASLTACLCSKHISVVKMIGFNIKNCFVLGGFPLKFPKDL